jgi:hypothetical protein
MENPEDGWVYAYDLRGPRFGWQADRRAREMASQETDVFDDHYCVLEHRIKDGKAQYRYRLTDEDRVRLLNPIPQPTKSTLFT